MRTSTGRHRPVFTVAMATIAPPTQAHCDYRLRPKRRVWLWLALPLLLLSAALFALIAQKR